MNSDEKMVLCECNNCSWRGDVSECNEIHALLDRVAVGDEFPAGECPKCEALAYLVCETHAADKGNIVILFVRGGVVDMIYKPTGLAVSVYDYDVDGEENTTIDSDGESCTIGHWDSQQKVNSHEHSSIITLELDRNSGIVFVRSWYSVGETLPDGSTQTIDTFDTLQEALRFAVQLNRPGFIDRWQSTSATPADSIDELDETFTPIHYPF